MLVLLMLLISRLINQSELRDPILKFSALVMYMLEHIFLKSN